ncbi:hypothetical protein H5410_050303 [Solanum commersonii]|uniref:Uncharacterized protein n=1 Tax=Solanum commersonii TaxID=4109 RepID=A0A9J5WX72_SOLCO|nr:hypothetical protein H5410_050303 [Solanum commersonii]
MMRKLETNECDQSCSDSSASTLIAKLDQFQHEKVMPKTLAAWSLEIDMMDDFLEMERLAAVSETVNKASSLTSDVVADDSSSEENPLSAEYETLSQRVVELEQKLEKIETDKVELENALSESRDALKVSNLKTLSQQQNSFSNQLLLQNYKASNLCVPHQTLSLNTSIKSGKKEKNK